MIYLLDFTKQPTGMYNRSPYGEVFTLSPAYGQILITNPDLEAFATISNNASAEDFFTVTIEDINVGRTSIDAMRHIKHLVLIYGWELSALMRRVHMGCFEMSFGGGERLWANSFGMGEPVN